MSHPFIDMSGKRYGHLTVIKLDHRKTFKDKHGTVLYWLCKCDCGRDHVAQGMSMRNGTAVSCGCKTGENLSGKKYGRLTVIKKSDRKKHREWLWECKCECGKTVYVPGNVLKGKHTLSCGCYKRDKARRGKKSGEGGINRLWWRYNHWAKKANRSFSLTKEQFIYLTKKIVSIVTDHQQVMYR